MPYTPFLLNFFLSFYFSVLGFDLRAYATQPAHFGMFFEIGFQELLAQSGFELQSS
jgi:hypothetical protein